MSRRIHQSDSARSTVRSYLQLPGIHHYYKNITLCQEYKGLHPHKTNVVSGTIFSASFGLRSTGQMGTSITEQRTTQQRKNIRNFDFTMYPKTHNQTQHYHHSPFVKFSTKNKEIKEIAQQFLLFHSHIRVQINNFVCPKKRIDTSKCKQSKVSGRKGSLWRLRSVMFCEENHILIQG
jgi:hypothetical protein